VVAGGPGYAVSAVGQAMTAGAAGQTVRIRMGNGKIITGVVDETGAIAAAL
ncbi:MAG: flagella basal body P-ring formation protein FlgA, partial [Simplicispira sp.]|nr:flagella basal body P-ring formation protein FlgA [Simplicispira sp.]MDD2713988.1 flagella basal body P-ring formation protein FlgA [Simplicispira sp.]